MNRRNRLAGLTLLVAVTLAGCTGAWAPAPPTRAPEAPAPAPLAPVATPADPPAIPRDDVGQPVAVVAPFPDCPSAPVADVRVGGQVLELGKVTGFGYYCGRNIDGVSPEILDETPAAPGARVDLQYRSATTWDIVTYQVLQGEKSVAEGPVPASGTFALPNTPGAYTVVLQFGSANGTISQSFRVAVRR